MSVSQPYTVVQGNGRGVSGVFYWDPSTGTEAVLLFKDDSASLPLEQRMWRAQTPMTPQQRSELLDEFSPVPKTGITDESRRSVPWGALHGAYRAHAGASLVQEIQAFRPPTQSTIDFLINWEVLPDGFRSSRDLMAHATELRCAREYLLAVYRDQSRSPAEQVAKAEGITLARARNLIDRARQHGYLTRVEGGVGGQLTAKAYAVASEIDSAETFAMMGEQRS